MNIKQETSKQRVQFDFSPEAYKRLKDLKEKTDASTNAEVVRNALKLYEWFIDQIGPDCILEIKDKEDNTLFRLPTNTLL
jgi:hypothetical protein